MSEKRTGEYALRVVNVGLCVAALFEQLQHFNKNTMNWVSGVAPRILIGFVDLEETFWEFPQLMGAIPMSWEKEALQFMKDNASALPEVYEVTAIIGGVVKVVCINDQLEALPDESKAATG